MRNKEMLRGCIAALILVFGILISSPSYPKGNFDQENIRAAEGKISAIDTFKSTVTVKSLMVYPVITYNEVILFVGPDTKIMYKGGAISIFDLVMGSPVNIKYAAYEDDISEALLITVTK